MEGYMQLDHWGIENMEMQINVMDSTMGNISLRRGECRREVMGNKVD